MKKFMVSVVEDIDPILATKLQSDENRIIANWRDTGMMIAMLFRADNKGFFGIMQAESAGIIMENMKTLPFYRYMTIEMVELVGK